MNNFKDIFDKLVQGPKAAKKGEDERTPQNVPVVSGENLEIMKNQEVAVGTHTIQDKHIKPPGRLQLKEVDRRKNNNRVPEGPKVKVLDHNQLKLRRPIKEVPTKIQNVDRKPKEGRKEEQQIKDEQRKPEMMKEAPLKIGPIVPVTLLPPSVVVPNNVLANSDIYLKENNIVSADMKDSEPSKNGVGDEKSHFSQRTCQTGGSIIKLKNFSVGDEEPERKYDSVRRTIQKFRNTWHSLKGTNLSVLEGPNFSIPKVTIMEYFNAQVKSKKLQPHRTAINVDRMESMTFRKLYDSSNIMEKVLVDVLEERAMWSNHVPNDDLIIALSIPNSHRMIVCIFGILKVGATYLPIDHLWPVDRIRKVILRMRPVLYIYWRESDYVRTLTSNSITSCVAFQDIWDRFEAVEFEYQPGNAEPFVEASDQLKLQSRIARNVVAFFNFSPTGAVVPVKFSNAAVFNRLILSWKSFPYEKRDIVLLQSSIHQVNSVVEIFAPLLQGITLVILNQVDLEHPFMFSSKVQDYHVTRVTISSAWLKAFLVSIKFNSTLMDWQVAFASVRIWYCMGEPVDKELAEQFFKHYLNRIKLKKKRVVALVNLLEVDENLGAVTQKIIADFKILKNGFYTYVGQTIPNSAIYVVNENFELVPLGTTGEILISSLQNCSVDTGLMARLEDSGANYKEFLHFYNHLIKSEDQLKSWRNWKPWHRNSYSCLQRTGCFGMLTSSCGKSHELLLESREPFLMTLEGSIVDVREVGTYLEEMCLFEEHHLLVYNDGEPNQKLVAFCVPKLEHKVMTSKEQTKYTEDTTLRLKELLQAPIVPDIVLLESIPKTIGDKINENALRLIYQSERNKRIELTDFHQLANALGSQDAVRAASIFLPMVTRMLGIPVVVLIESLDKTFFHFGGTTAQSIFIVDDLHSQQYFIGLEEFLRAENLLHIIMTLSEIENKDKILSFQIDLEGRDEVYQVELITEFHKSEVVEFLSEAYTAKGTIEYEAGIRRETMKEHLNKTWPLYTFKYFSFVVVGTGGKFGEKHRNVGVIINVDSGKYFHQLTELKSCDRSISYKQQVIEYLSSGKWPAKRSKLLEILYVGSSRKFLNARDNEEVDKILIGQAFKVAKEYHYDAVIFPCFDDILSIRCTRDHGFRIIMQCQLNRFIASDGHQPFKKFPDSYNASLCYKKVGQ